MDDLFTLDLLSGTDPGLVLGGGANPWVGAPTKYIYTFSEKSLETKEILVHGAEGACLECPPKSVTVYLRG